MPLIKHKYPVGQKWIDRESGRLLQFTCHGVEHDTLTQAIDAQARLENNPRPAAPPPRKKSNGS